MNKQGKSRIDWTDYTWNPITGCLNGCEYCYARKMYKRFRKSFKPQIHYKRLNEPLKIKKPSKIFTCSVSDFWGEGVPQLWRDEVYNTIKACPEHSFQILTKQPQNITKEDYEHMPDNVWVGISITEGKYLFYLYQTKSDWTYRVKFLSVEPLLGSIDLSDLSPVHKPDWIIIGGLTPEPVHETAWVSEILAYADTNNIPVFMKKNLRPVWKSALRQEWPGERG